MYSIVLLAAMTTGGDAPACHFGGHGCAGYGCAGYDCGGCGGGHKLFGGLFHRHHNDCCGASACGCCGAAAPVCGCCGAAAPAPVCGCCGSATSAPPAVEEKKEDKDEDEGDEDDKEMKKEAPKKVGQADAPAKLIVRVPAEAKLTIDGAATKSTSARRVFVSPMLTAGKVYSYTLQAQTNDQTVTKTVDIRAGQTTEVDLSSPASVASR